MTEDEFLKAEARAFQQVANHSDLCYRCVVADLGAFTRHFYEKTGDCPKWELLFISLR